MPLIIPDPLAGFRLSDQDTAADPKYYGYLSPKGDWYILKENTANGTFRYCYGTSGYADAWTARASQTYGYFDAVWPS